METAVYLFTGFLDSGKTTFIKAVSLLKGIVDKESIDEVCADTLNFNFFGYVNLKKRKRQYTRSHSGNCFRGKCPKVKNAKTIDDTFKNDLER